ncbi:MAG: ComF family protein [Leptolyngbyaceae cyanobacterium CRU_2_3]|nr:ComF family protein [Leptolyngbyaceae cyanobacterium CRU_2_3]
MKWTGNLGNLLDVFLQPQCPICERPAAGELCLDCKRQLRRCQFIDHNRFWHPPLPVFAWGEYGGALKRLLVALKYNNKPQLAYLLGKELAQSWLAASLEFNPKITTALTVVPIPLHASKQKQRGYNQAELIAKAFCQGTGLQLQAGGLIRSRNTEAQFGLNPEARSSNLADAFQIGKDFLRLSQPRAILIVDDIYTTGTTARSAAATLRRHQISVIGVVAVAKAGK